MLVKSQIIVLHTIKHGDNGVVVQCYSNTAGRQSLYFRGSSKKHSASHLHKLGILDVVAYHSGTASMPTIKEISAPYNLNSIRTDIYKSSIAIFISELLGKTVREAEGNPQLYSFLSSSIQILEHLTDGVTNFHIHFITHLCKMLGFMPYDNYSSSTPIFDPLSAKFCPNGNFMTPLESKLLHSLLNTPSTNLQELLCNGEVLKLSGEVRTSFTKKMVEYLSHHIGNSIEIKSLDILHQIFC